MRLLAFLILLTTGISAQNLLPQPTKIESLNGEFIISNQTNVLVSNPSVELKKYASRFVERLQFKAGVYFPSIALRDTVTLNQITIGIQKNIDSLFVGIDESYSITVTPEKIEINAANNIGAYRGMETLLQMIQVNENKSFVKAVKITDNPRFPWRGLLIDVGRHWIPAHIIKRNIDAMAAVKMNVLHLHLTEDQGFRIESKKFPKLHELGNDGNYFTQHEIQDIIKYAKERGIRVIPEFDIPGHTTSWLVGYPELASIQRNYEVATRFGIFKGSLNPTEESTYDFLDTLLTEMCQLFPDAYFHIGGDENNGMDWNENKKIQKFMQKNGLNDNNELQAYFNRRILEILHRNNKIMVGWDEIYTNDIPKSIVIQSWRGKESMFSSAKNGYPSILSNGYYLDKLENLESYYLNDPLPPTVELTSKQQKMILGGEATMWTEIVNEFNIESRIWPATLAVAERLWSQQENCDLDKFYKKAPLISLQLQEFGLTHLTFQDALFKLIANNSKSQFWEPFIRSLEPVKGYKRHNFIRNTPKYSTVAPLNRLPDVCYTESFAARQFNELAKNNCKDGHCKFRRDILMSLAAWAQSAENFQRMSFLSPSLAEGHELALKVQELCELTWRKVNSPRELPEKDEERAKILIDEVENYKLDVRFAPIEGIKAIFN